MAKRDLFEHIRKTSPQVVLLGGVILGAILVGASILLGIASVTLTPAGGARQVGYAAAPNWSIAFTLVFPLFVYFAMGAIRATDRAFSSLAQMLVDHDGNPATDAANTIERRYRRMLGKSSQIATVLACLALAASLIEWVLCSVMPLLFGSPSPEQEVDWAVAKLGQGICVRMLNVVFTFVAYSTQGVYAATLLVFLVYLVVFADVVRQLTDATTPPILVPDVQSTDPRRGFQHLGRVVEEVVFACGCVFLVFWLSRLQNLYLHSSTSTLWAFLTADLFETVLQFDAKAFFRAITDTGGLEYSSTVVMIGAVVVLSACVGVPLHTLRRAAVLGRDAARALTSRHPRLFARHCSDEAVDKGLNEMVVWPIAYPQLNELLFWIAFALLSICFYRLGVAFVMAWIWRVAKRAIGSK